MPTLSDILHERSKALLQRFNHEDVPPLIATDDLVGKIHIPPYGGGTIERMPGRTGPMIWRKPGTHASSLWVPKTYGPYRDAFFVFIEQEYGPGVDMTGKDLFDVDHIFNKARAPQNFLVRVEAVVSAINQSHGRRFEKKNTNSIVELSRKQNGKDHRKMTFITALKLADLDPPRNLSDSDQIDAIKNYFQKEGWAPFLIAQAIDDLLEVAERR